MRIYKKIKLPGFLIVLCILNMVLNFLIVLVNGASDTMWKQYYEEEEIDTLFVGSSISAATFDPLIFDDILGVNSFNMGTPAQSFVQSLEALESVFDEHEIRTVILSAGFFSFQEKVLDVAEMSFVMGRTKGKGGIAGIMDSVSWLMSEKVVENEKSVNYLFPWLYNNITLSAEGIYGNILEKMGLTNSDTSNRMPKGYRPYFGEGIDWDRIWTENSLYYYSGTVESEMMESFEEIMELCNSKGVKLVVVNTPHPVYDVVSCHGIYEEMDKMVRDLCESYEIEYYDFSLVKPELFDTESEYFYDCEHLNHKGAQAFSKMFCDFWQKRNSGEDVNEYFYTVDEYYDVHNILLDEWIKICEAK